MLAHDGRAWKVDGRAQALVGPGRPGSGYIYTTGIGRGGLKGYLLQNQYFKVARYVDNLKTLNLSKYNLLHISNALQKAHYADQTSNIQAPLKYFCVNSCFAHLIIYVLVAFNET